MKANPYTDAPYQGPSEIISISINLTGSTVVNSRTDGTVRVWKSTGDKLVEGTTITQVHEKAVERVSWHPKHEYTFATVGRDQWVRIWRASNGHLEQLVEITTPGPEATACQFVNYSVDGELMAVVDRNGTVTLLLVAKQYQMVAQMVINDHIYDFAWFNFEHKYFAVALHGGAVKIYETQYEDGAVKMVEKTQIMGHRSVTSIAVSPRGGYFAVGSTEGVVSIYHDMVVEQVITDIDEPIEYVRYSRDGAHLAISYGHTVRIVDRNGSILVQLPGREIEWFPHRTSFVVADGRMTLYRQ